MLVETASKSIRGIPTKTWHMSVKGRLPKTNYTAGCKCWLGTTITITGVFPVRMKRSMTESRMKSSSSQLSDKPGSKERKHSIDLPPSLGKDSGSRRKEKMELLLRIHCPPPLDIFWTDNTEGPQQARMFLQRQ